MYTLTGRFEVGSSNQSKATIASISTELTQVDAQISDPASENYGKLAPELLSQCYDSLSLSLTNVSCYLTKNGPQWRTTSSSPHYRST